MRGRDTLLDGCCSEPREQHPPGNLLPRTPPLTYYALLVVAGLMHLSHEELQANNSINDDDEEHKKGNVQQRHHGLDDGVQDHLETCATRASTVAAAAEPLPPL